MATTKQYTAAITRRFLQLMDEVIKDGHVNNKTQFGQKIGEHQQNFSKMEEGTRAPTLEQIAIACKLFGYNPTWLILNLGEKKLKPREQLSFEQRLNELETEVSRIKRLLK